MHPAHARFGLGRTVSPTRVDHQSAVENIRDLFVLKYENIVPRYDLATLHACSSAQTGTLGFCSQHLGHLRAVPPWDVTGSCVLRRPSIAPPARLWHHSRSACGARWRRGIRDHPSKPWRTCVRFVGYSGCECRLARRRQRKVVRG